MDDWTERMRIRKCQFLSRAKEKLSSVAQLLSSEDCLSTAAGLHGINRIFHQLAGGGGIYELEVLCDLTIKAEELTARLASVSPAITQHDIEQLRIYTEALFTVIEEYESTITVGSSIKVGCGQDVLMLSSTPNIVDCFNAFGAQGLRLRTVKSASSAAGAIVTRMPDALVIETPLSEDDRLEVIARLRSQPGGLECIVIVLAQSGDEELALRSEGTADAVFCKTRGIEELAQKVKQLISIRDGAPVRMGGVEGREGRQDIG